MNNRTLASVDWEKFREWHSSWLADYIEKHGRPPAQVRLNENDSQRHRLKEVM